MLIFLVMVLLILSFAIIWNFDLHKVIHLKMRSQNAADAAAMPAARWQGITLNLIGDLNIMQAVALSTGDSNTARLIAETQTRLCYTGPVIGLLACQQAAKHNGIYANESFSDRMMEHADTVLSDYNAIFAEPYPECWNEYGAMLMNVAGAGVAAGPDNARLYTDYSGGHTLLDIGFYDAVAGQAWCWFYWYALTLLNTYTDYESWPALPPQIPETQPENSEFFGVGLTTFNTLPGGEVNVANLNNARTARNISPQEISNSVATAEATWFVYQQSRWTDWSAMKDPSFPVFPERQVRTQYDYSGADAATRAEAVPDRWMPNAPARRMAATAAAKPFGYLTTGDGTQVRPDSCQIVLPAFREVRLIPVDTSSAPAGGAYNLEWRDHIENHLQAYLENGLGGLNADCWYCRQLYAWEDAAFRQAGIDWLADTNNVNSCHRSGPGHGPDGGTRRGH